MNRNNLGTAMNRNNIGSRAGVGSRMGTSAGMADGSSARPLTSVSGAGYKGANNAVNANLFDPLGKGFQSGGPAPPLVKKSESGPEGQAKDLEMKVHKYIEVAAEAISLGDEKKALENAKLAGKAERNLVRHREQYASQLQGNDSQTMTELSFSVCLLLANAYHLNRLYDEAINTYNIILKNKQYTQSGRMRVNMGNIYFIQKKYPQAIKMYRMALDQIPSNMYEELRIKIIKNIGFSFVKLGKNLYDYVKNFYNLFNLF